MLNLDAIRKGIKAVLGTCESFMLLKGRFFPDLNVNFQFTMEKKAFV